MLQGSVRLSDALKQKLEMILDNTSNVAVRYKHRLAITTKLDGRGV